MKQFAAVLAFTLAGLSTTTYAENTDPCKNKYGKDSLETVKNLSLFNQYFQSKKYAESFPYWYYLFQNAPCVAKNITFNGPYIVKQVLRKDAYKARFNGLVDTIFLCYQKRIEFYGEEGEVKGKLGYDMATLRPNEIDKALAVLAESFALTGDKTDDNFPLYYVHAATIAYKSKVIELDSMIAIYDKMMRVVSINLEREEGNAKQIKQWKKSEDKMNQLMLPYLDCDKIIEIKTPVFNDKPDDLKSLKNIISLLDRGNCSDGDFYLTVSEKIYSIEPDAAAALAIGKAYKSRKEYSKAISYFEKGLEAAKTDQEKADLYYDIANLSLVQGQLSQARNYARKALAINPNMGDAYILIGDAYASSASSESCKDDKLGSAPGFWAAVDKYTQAKSVDASVAARANQKIAKYKAYFPGNEQLFFLDLNAGDSFTVGCWIGETTTIRSSD